MQQPDFKRFMAIMTGMAKLYEREIDATLLDAYWMALRDWDLDDFEKAAALLMGTEKFMPRPAAFNDLRKAGKPTPGEAWARAVQACGSAIQCGQVTPNGTCGDPMIDDVVRMIGGYGAIAMCEVDKLHFLERRFAEHYESLEDRQTVREAVLQISNNPVRLARILDGNGHA